MCTDHSSVLLLLIANPDMTKLPNEVIGPEGPYILEQEPDMSARVGNIFTGELTIVQLTTAEMAALTPLPVQLSYTTVKDSGKDCGYLVYNCRRRLNWYRTSEPKPLSSLAYGQFSEAASTHDINNMTRSATNLEVYA